MKIDRKLCWSRFSIMSLALAYSLNNDYYRLTTQENKFTQKYLPEYKENCKAFSWYQHWINQPTHKINLDKRGIKKKRKER